MDAKTALEGFYGAYNEEDRFAPKHGQVEFLTTMRYIARFLKPDMRILEIGAGTGRYSRAIAKMGYSVDAIELIQSNIDRFSALIEEGTDVRVWQGDALNLSGLADGAYDLVLLLGPMYHLFTPEDQRQAFSEALRVLAPGGTLMTAYCLMDASILVHGFVRGYIFDLIGKNMVDTDHFIARSNPEDIFQLWRKEDIDALNAHFPVRRLHYVATDLAANYIHDTIDAMDEKTFAMYLRYHFTICERPDLVGASHHVLDILRKEG